MECIADKPVFWTPTNTPYCLSWNQSGAANFGFAYFLLALNSNKKKQNKKKKQTEKQKIPYLRSHFIFIRRRRWWVSSLTSLPFLDLLGVKNMVAVYTKRRLQKTNKQTKYTIGQNSQTHPKKSVYLWSTRYLSERPIKKLLSWFNFSLIRPWSISAGTIGFVSSTQM